MVNARVAAGASLAALGLMLAACDGGGVNSTPTPTPSGGGNSPTPTPGGGGAPTPTPTHVNSDLIAPLESESFTNFARMATGTYSTTEGAATEQSQGKVTGTISFDASTGSYTLSVPGRSQTFSKADLVQPGDYRRTNGSVIDDLTLTPAGTSGSAPLTYRYVGAAFWQRQTIGSSSIKGTMDAFVYGVPSKAIPVSGKASYAVEVLGAINSSWVAAPGSFAGKGALVADFGRGKLSGDAEFSTFRTDGLVSVGRGLLNFDATLAANSTAFAGTVQARFESTYTGTIDGGFFGPNGQDVGAVYSATDSENGDVMVGALLGTRDTSLDVIPLADIKGVTHFIGAIGGGDAHLEVLAYDAAVKTYTIPDFPDEPIGVLKLGPSELAASQPDSRFIEYDVSQNGHRTKALFYRTGSANPEIQLTYASFALVEVKPTTIGSTKQPYYRQILFGSRTLPELMPRSGSATYNGQLYGSGVAHQGALQDQNITNTYNVTGTARFIADFGRYSVNVELHPFLTDRSSGAVTDYGIHTSNAQIMDRASFAGRFDTGNGSLTGYFFGPRAEEIGASFGLTEYNSQTSFSRFVQGVAVGKQD